MFINLESKGDKYIGFNCFSLGFPTTFDDICFYNLMPQVVISFMEETNNSMQNQCMKKFMLFV